MKNIKLHIIDVYLSYFAGVRHSCRTNEEAYEEVERKCREIYGVNIFNCYETFRVMKHRYEEQNPPPTKSRNLLTSFGYFGRYYELLSDHTSIGAYKVLHKEVLADYNIEVHKNYNAFHEELKRHARFHKFDKTLLRWVRIAGEEE
jgi:hypothetical protein